MVCIGKAIIQRNNIVQGDRIAIQHLLIVLGQNLCAIHDKVECELLDVLRSEVMKFQLESQLIATDECGNGELVEDDISLSKVVALDDSLNTEVAIAGAEVVPTFAVAQVTIQVDILKFAYIDHGERIRLIGLGACLRIVEAHEDSRNACEVERDGVLNVELSPSGCIGIHVLRKDGGTNTTIGNRENEHTGDGSCIGQTDAHLHHLTTIEALHHIDGNIGSSTDRARIVGNAKTCIGRCHLVGSIGAHDELSGGSHHLGRRLLLLLVQLADRILLQRKSRSSLKRLCTHCCSHDSSNEQRE